MPGIRGYNPQMPLPRPQYRIPNTNPSGPANSIPGPMGTYNTGQTSTGSVSQNPYPASITQSAGDYDSIMAGYRNILNSPDNSTSTLEDAYRRLLNGGNTTPQVTAQTVNYNPLAPPPTSNFNPLPSPNLIQYQDNPELEYALAKLKNLSDTGGYSSEDISNLRARGVSPIRSVYANAQQSINRQKALQGGYSPNYTAATSKLTRDLSEEVASKTTDVNAGIAQNVAANKLSIAPIYANAEAAQEAFVNNINSRNADTINNTNAANMQGYNENNRFNAQNYNDYARTNNTNILNTNNANANSVNDANRFNATNAINQTNNQQSILARLQQLYSDNSSRRLSTLDAMRALYGTTPALPALYGSQAATAANLALSSPRQPFRGGGMVVR